MNVEYVKIVRDGHGFEYAPDWLDADLKKPSEDDFNRAGYYRNGIEPPSPPDGNHVSDVKYGIVDGVVRSFYVYSPDSNPPRHWTRLKMKTALAQLGFLGTAKSVLSGIEIAPGYTALEALGDCDYIEEGFPNQKAWSATLDSLAAGLGKTREEIDAFIASVPTEEY